jgi:ATP-dependent Zn protease
MAVQKAEWDIKEVGKDLREEDTYGFVDTEGDVLQKTKITQTEYDRLEELYDEQERQKERLEKMLIEREVLEKEVLEVEEKMGSDDT